MVVVSRADNVAALEAHWTRVGHVHGAGAVDAIVMPNRYRKMFAERMKSDAELAAENAACLAAMRDEWPEKAARALGRGICTCFEPILQWAKV